MTNPPVAAPVEDAARNLAENVSEYLGPDLETWHYLAIKEALEEARADERQKAMEECAAFVDSCELQDACEIADAIRRAFEEKGEVRT